MRELGTVGGEHIDIEGVARVAEARWRDPGADPLDDVDRSLLVRAQREGSLIPLAARLLFSTPSPLAIQRQSAAARYLTKSSETAPSAGQRKL